MSMLEQAIADAEALKEAARAAAEADVLEKYNGEVKYRDPQEENHPRRELIDEYI